MVTEKHPLLSKYCYILLHYSIPPTSLLPTSEHRKAVNRASKILGVRFWRIQVTDERIPQGLGERYLFRFPEFKENGLIAQKIAESFLLPLSILHPCLHDDERALFSKIPYPLVKNRKTISLGELIKYEESRIFQDEYILWPASVYSRYESIPEEYVISAWKSSAIIFTNSHLFQSIRFLSASQTDFYVWESDIRKLVNLQSSKPLNSIDQSLRENALQNAYKAIEAVIGDLPKEDKKLFQKLNSVGINPMEQVGYVTKEPINQVLRKMNFARDKKAAHGSTGNRDISSIELAEYQACARYVVFSAIGSIMGENIYM